MTDQEADDLRQAALDLRRQAADMPPWDGIGPRIEQVNDRGDMLIHDPEFARSMARSIDDLLADRQS